MYVAVDSLMRCFLVTEIDAISEYTRIRSNKNSLLYFVYFVVLLIAHYFRFMSS